MLLGSCQSLSLCSCNCASTSGGRAVGVSGYARNPVLVASFRRRFRSKRTCFGVTYRSLEWTAGQESRTGLWDVREARESNFCVTNKRGLVTMKLAVRKDGFEDDNQVPGGPGQDKVTFTQKRIGRAKGQVRDGSVEVRVERLSNNSRKIVARIGIGAPLEVVWGILTDYEHLADFIPGLAESKLLEKKTDGARLYQVGEQNIALGLKFKAKAVVDCVEKPVDVCEKMISRDIDFNTVEGDFQVFRGTWRMEQEVDHGDKGIQGQEGSPGQSSEAVTFLSYILTVQPKMWLPVGLVEGMLTTEIKSNLKSIREKSLQP